MEIEEQSGKLVQNADRVGACCSSYSLNSVVDCFGMNGNALMCDLLCSAGMMNPDQRITEDVEKFCFAISDL